MNYFSTQIHTVFVDLLAGKTVAHRVFTDKPNLEVIKHFASSSAVQKTCREFFLNGSVSKVMRSMIRVNTVKAGDCIIGRQDLYTAIQAISGNMDASTVIMEILCPVLLELGLMGGLTDFTTRITYPRGFVTTEQLRIDAAMQEVVRVLGDVKKINITDRRYSPGIFGDELAVALRPVGLRFSDINEYAAVFPDILRGIRSYVDHTGSVARVTDPSWRDHTVIQELVNNATFLVEALEIPFGTSCEPSVPMWKLQDQATVILGQLKTSARYKMISREQALRRFNVASLRDLEDVKQAVVVWESANMVAEAQTVLAYEDVMVPGTIILSPTTERGAEATTQAYGNVKAYGTDAASAVLLRALAHAAEADALQRYAELYFADSRKRSEAELEAVYCLLAGGARYYRLDNPTVAGRFDRKFAVEVKRMPFLRTFACEGHMEGDLFVTPNWREMFFALEDRTATEVVQPSDQMLSNAALDARLVNYPIDGLVPMTSRFAFSLPFGKNRIDGSFVLKDVASLRAFDGSSFVPATYNREVMYAVSKMLSDTMAVLNALASEPPTEERLYSLAPGIPAGPELAAAIRSIIASMIVGMIRGCSAGWRDEVHKGMITRHVVNAKYSYEESITIRTRLRSRNFACLADLFAFVFLMRSQGVITDDMSFWKDVMKDEALLRDMVRDGSDRVKDAI